MNNLRLTRLIDAPLEKVWAAADFTKSAGPYPMEVRCTGNPDNNFVGFTRACRSGKRVVTERLLEVDPMRSYTYTLAEGVPVKEDYRGKVEFAPKGSSTQLIWTANFTPKYLGTGWLGAIILRVTVKRIVDAIEAECRSTDVYS